MGHLFIVLAGALVAAALVFGVTVLIMGGDQELDPAEPDGRAMPLPSTRPLAESDIGHLRFDVTLRGYRMVQVDQALRRAGYDLGYKEELIGVLEAEVDALRAGRVEEADALQAAREAAARPASEPEDGQPMRIELDAIGGEAATVDVKELSDGEPSDGKLADQEPGAGETEDGKAELEDQSWPVGFRTMDDAAAAEPAK